MHVGKSMNKEKIRVGWIGTGVMGKSMCANLLRAGFNCSVYNRTKEKASELLSLGAIWKNSPKEIAESSDVVFAIVSYPKDVREVYFGKDGVLSGAKAGDVLVDMSTSEPSLAMEIYSRAKELGIFSIDAPVSGGDIGARNATLSIMIGGDREIVEKLNPLFCVLGKTIVHQGSAGAGQHCKMCNQIAIATNMIGVCEALLYAYKAGLELETVLASISGGGAGSWSISNLAPRIVAGNFEPGFFVEHFVKDMGIALREAERMDLKLPGLELAKSLYDELVVQGGAKKGTHALQIVLAKLSGVDWLSR